MVSVTGESGIRLVETTKLLIYLQYCPFKTRFYQLLESKTVYVGNLFERLCSHFNIVIETVNCSEKRVSPPMLILLIS